MLGEILEVKKMSQNMKGIGFDPSSMSKKDTNHPNKFVPPKNKKEFQMLNHMAQQPTRNMYIYNGKT